MSMKAGRLVAASLMTLVGGAGSAHGHSKGREHKARLVNFGIGGLMSGIFFFLFSLVAAPATAAPAQDRLWGKASHPADIRMIHEFSRCLAERRGDDARAVLALDYRSDAYDLEMRRLAKRHHGCAPPWGRLGFNSVLFAGGLAEALIGPLESETAFTARVALAAGVAPLEARDDPEYMGLCLVRSAPSQVFAILAAEPTSDAERAAMSALAPRFQTCLRRGATVRMNRAFTRSLLALAAYRLSNHAAASSPVSGS